MLNEVRLSLLLTSAMTASSHFNEFSNFFLLHKLVLLIKHEPCLPVGVVSNKLEDTFSLRPT